MATKITTQKVIESLKYTFREGKADKVYHLELIHDQQYRTPGYGFHVMARYGRRGSTLTEKLWPVIPVDERAARKMFEDKKAERIAHGYTLDTAEAWRIEPSKPIAVADMIPQRAASKLPLHQLLNEVEDPAPYISAPATKWWMQSKEDGVRAFLIAEGGTVRAASRTHLPVSVDEAVAAAVRELKIDVVLDGEMCGPVFHAFDVIQFTDIKTKKVQDLRARPYGTRFDALELIVKKQVGPLRRIRTWKHPEQKKVGLQDLKNEGAEGCVFKDPAATYQNGRPNSGGCALKHKFWNMATVFVVAKVKDDGKRSVDVAVCGGPGSTGPGKLPFVMRQGSPPLWCSRIGSVTIPPNKDVPSAGDIIEVRYLYCVSSLVQAVYHGLRNDKLKPDTYDSLKFKAVADEPAPPPKQPAAPVMRRCDSCGQSVQLGADKKLLAHYAIHTLVCPAMSYSMNPEGIPVQPARLLNAPAAPKPVEVIAAETTKAMDEYWSGSASAQIAKPLCLCGHTELRHRKKGPAGDGYCLSCTCECYETEEETEKPLPLPTFTPTERVRIIGDHVPQAIWHRTGRVYAGLSKSNYEVELDALPGQEPIRFICGALELERLPAETDNDRPISTVVGAAAPPPADSIFTGWIQDTLF